MQGFLLLLQKQLKLFIRQNEQCIVSLCRVCVAVVALYGSIYESFLFESVICLHPEWGDGRLYLGKKQCDAISGK